MRRARSSRFALAAVIWSALLAPCGASSWILPTANRALYAGDYGSYYMYVPRTWEGKAYRVWQGGQYGFVRTPVKSAGEVLYAKFHEGLDIRPTRRDSRGDPLDLVWSVGPGTVVHVNPVTGHSSYGKYVVVEHACQDGLYYSLYAHLARAEVEIGQKVQAGTPLGIMGYTGPGLNRERAHLHFEINLLLESQFERWHASGSSGNPHGIHHGFNLAGIPVADYFLACRARPGLTISQFLSQREPHYRVVVPKEGSRMEILRRYRWLLDDEDSGEGTAWEIAFDGSGLPLSVRGVHPAIPIAEPQIAWVRDSVHSHAYHTRRRLTNSGKHLSVSGLRYVNLVAGRF